MADFCTVSDINSLFRTLTTAETTKATALIPIVSNRLRIEARKVGKNLDLMIEDDSQYADVVKSVTVDVISRCLMTPTSGAPMTQVSESALGYSVSGTFLSPGGGIFIKNSELAALGLKRQRLGAIDLC